ncbi:MAG: molybdopterin molybdotransferase [Glaciecola sp.]
MSNELQPISVASATDLILNAAMDYGIERVSLLDSIGRVLAEDITADRDFPPFNRVCMDGICIKSDDFENGHRSFNIVGVQAAGSKPEITIESEECLEIMTGAMLPDSADCVIRYEDISISDGWALVNIEALPNGKNIHPRGVDAIKGKILLSKDQLISASEINILATVGISEPNVKRLPKVAVVSTGNELVEVNQNPNPWEIRRSNAYGIQGLLSSLKINSQSIHVSDNENVMADTLKCILEDYDVVILSGGVSKGKYDYVPDILQSLGVKKVFHGVNQRPGKPFWYGEMEMKKVFALPGNPMSSISCTLNYILPYIRKSLGLAALCHVNAKLKTKVVFKPKLTRFMEAFAKIDSSGQCWISPLKSNGSGDYTELVKSNAMLILPADEDSFEPGQLVKFFYI